MPQLIPISIAGTVIRQDATGRYCLNDLHRAAGGARKHKPANFMRLDSTHALVAEIDRGSDVSNAFIVLQGGILQGTYVVKELVYAYAMWISPAFHLKVIRAYDALAQPAAGLNFQPSEMLAVIQAMAQAQTQMLQRVDRLCGVVEKLIETLPAILNAQRPRLRRPPIFEKDLPLILALREQGATLTDIVRTTGFGQTAVWYVLEGRYAVMPGGRVKKMPAPTAVVSAIVRSQGGAQ